MSILTHLAHEVSRVGELSAAHGLVGAFAAGEGLAVGGGDGLALFREPLDFDVDVGVGGSDDYEWGSVGIGIGFGDWGFGGGCGEGGK